MQILLPLLTVLFIGLKLTGHIAWSWWWVLAPTWIPLAIIIAGLLLAAIGWWSMTPLERTLYQLERRLRK